MKTKPKGRRVKVGERLRREMNHADMLAGALEDWIDNCDLIDAGVPRSATEAPWVHKRRRRPTNPRTPRRTGRRGKVL